MIYEFAATQDLHGYNEPWAPGGKGNNLPNPEAGNLTMHGITCAINDKGEYALSGSLEAGTEFLHDYPVAEYTIQSGDYLHLLNDKVSNSVVFGIKFTDSTKWELTFASVNRIVEIPEAHIGKTINAVRVYVAATLNGVFSPMIVASSAATPFAPYSNICPPEGFNIWDPTNQEYIQVYAGYVNANTRELYLRPVYPEYAGEELVGPWMSSLDPYEQDTTPTEGAFVIDFGGELTSYEITPFMLQTLLDSLGIRQHFTNGAGLLNSLMDQAQGRVRSEEELLHLSRPLTVIAIGDQLPAGLTFKPISKDVLPGLPGKFIR